MRITPDKNTKQDHQRARDLRNDSSPFERKLWHGIRTAAAIHQLKFRRQQPIHPFIVDFACMEARLLIELDGDSHDTRLAYDKERDEYLKKEGFHILRFTNADVAENLESVVTEIFNEAGRLMGKKDGA